MSGQAARQVHSTLRAALNQAVRWEVLASNPAAGIRMAGVERKERKPIWSLAQYQQFMATQSPPWSVLWALLAATGMRISEALALRWEDVAFAPRAVIQIRRTVARGPSGYYEDSPKSAAGRRPIVMGPELSAMLAAWKEEQSSLPRRVGANEPRYVVGTVTGQRRAYSGVKQRLEAEIARCGLPVITLHALRHMSATEQLAAGVPLKVVSARLGHAKVALTSDLYGHVLDEHQESAAAVVDVFAAPRGMGVPWTGENPDNQDERS
jgi:integrase